MCHPFRRLCFYVGEKLGKSLDEVMALPAHEIYEWVAYDNTINPEWVEKYEHEKELERQRKMSSEQKARLFRGLLGGA